MLFYLVCSHRSDKAGGMDGRRVLPSEFPAFAFWAGLVSLTFMFRWWYLLGMGASNEPNYSEAEFTEPLSGSLESSDDEGEYFKGKVRSPEEGTLRLSVDDLPTFALVNNSKTSGKLHRVQMGGKGTYWDREELRPVCAQGDTDRQVAINGHKYSQDWKVVRIARRLPFAKYGLCQNPNCFRHVEIVE